MNTSAQLDFESIEYIHQFAVSRGFPDAIASQRMEKWILENQQKYEMDVDDDNDELIEGMSGLLDWYNRKVGELSASEKPIANSMADYLTVYLLRLKSAK